MSYADPRFVHQSLTIRRFFNFGAQQLSQDQTASDKEDLPFPFTDRVHDMSEIRSGRLNDDGQAALLMTGAMASFALNDTLVKLLSQDMAPAQIMALRGLIVSVLLLLLAQSRGALTPIGRAFHPAVILRTLADIGTTLAYISALQHLPIANASAIFQALPFTITIGAALFLGETVGWRRWLAITVGFVGVIVILRPSADGFNIYASWVLISVVLAAVRDLVTRRMPPSIPSIQIAAMTSIAVSLTGFLLLPLVGWSEVEPRHWGLLAFAAFAIGAGYIMIVSSMRIGQMSFVAPFRYSILLFTFISGMLVFGERPDAFMIVGAFLVVGSGAYTIHHDAKLRRRTLASPVVE